MFVSGLIFFDVGIAEEKLKIAVGDEIIVNRLIVGQSRLSEGELGVAQVEICAGADLEALLLNLICSFGLNDGLGR